MAGPNQKKTETTPLGLQMICRSAHADLRQAKFCFEDFEEEWVAPCSPSDRSRNAIFLAQLNFVPLGLLLTFDAQHKAIRMTEISFISSLLDKWCIHKGPTETESKQIALFNCKYIKNTTYEPHGSGQELRKIAPTRHPHFSIDMHLHEVLIMKAFGSEYGTPKEEAIFKHIRAQLDLTC